MGINHMWSNLKSLLTNQGKLGKEGDMDSLISKPHSLNEEYKQAFRTHSYLEISNIVQDHLVTIKSCLDEPCSTTASASSRPPSSPPSPLPPQSIHLSGYLLDPHQESLITSFSHTSNPHHHQLLLNYFEISLEASKICESLLMNIHRVRNNHRRIKKVIKLIKRLPDDSSLTDDEYHVACKNLAAFASQTNPFSSMNPKKFQEWHQIHALLFQQLTSRCRKTKKRKKIIRAIKRIIASFLVVGCGALGVVVLILAMHCVVGLVALPGLVMWTAMTKKIKRAERKCNEKRLEGLALKLDIAARGVYIMINDFGTMSQIVKRLRDELERRKYLAGVCVGKGKSEMLKKVVREFQMDDSWFVEELEELEKRICLCFLDINRSTRILVREMFD